MILVLTTVPESQAPQEARFLLERSYNELPETESRVIMEIITTIMVYKFGQLDRMEVERMLDITLQETRVYREIKEEGRSEGRIEGREEGREEGRVEGRQEEAVNLVIRLLTKRIGRKLPVKIRKQISGLPLPVLEDLSEALLDFTNLADLQAWLSAVGN